jgi:3-deoxy-7-phosphoheptulonate synthase
MILVLKENVPHSEVLALLDKLEWMGLKAQIVQEENQCRLAILYGLDANVKLSLFTAFPQIAEVLPFELPYKLASRQLKQEKTVIEIKGKKIGGKELAIMAGPCSIESEEQIFSIAEEVFRSGATILRGGAFKPRTSPYSFQGLGETGLKYMKQAADRYGLLTISEVMDVEHLDIVAAYCDIIQIGARNMQNFSLLKKLGSIPNPIFLKRGMSATYQDFLMSAEYILSAGNPNVILCERGIKTFETHSRNTLDLAAVPILQELTHLPIIVDPSHGTGIRKMVPAMAYAGIAAGADGLMVEIHPTPEKAFSDADQTLDFAQYSEMMKKIKAYAALSDRTL